MSWPVIREQIASILAAVNGVGVVHQYMRLAHVANKVKSLYVDGDGLVNACEISRGAVKRRQAGVGIKMLAHIAVIRFYYGVNDAKATEIIFQQLLDDAAAAFDSNKTLNESCVTTHADWPLGGALGLEIDTIDHRMCGGILCHYAEARLGAIEEKAD